MKDIIRDLVNHTAGLGFIDSVKVKGTDEVTQFEAMDVDKSVIVNATTHTPVAEFKGEFGMGNLGFLSGIINLESYVADDATVEVSMRERNGEQQPESITFKDTFGNNDQYRFMSKEIVEQQLKTVKFKGVNWDVTIEPSKPRVSELGAVANIYSAITPTFSARTEKNNLIFNIGSADSGGHFGKRTFAQNVDGALVQGWSWPLSQVLAILKLGMSGMCVMQFSDQGALQISIDSGLGKYDYILPAMNQ